MFTNTNAIRNNKERTDALDRLQKIYLHFRFIFARNITNFSTLSRILVRFIHSILCEISVPYWILIYCCFTRFCIFVYRCCRYCKIRNILTQSSMLHPDSISLIILTDLFVHFYRSLIATI